MNKDDLSLFECKNLKEYERVIKEYINKHIDKEKRTSINVKPR